MRLISFLIPRAWRESVLRDLEDEARVRGKGRLWLLGQLLRVGVRLQPVINGDTLMTEIRYAIRSLWKSKGFALGASAVFLIGIGINIATFSVVDRILFRSLPFEDSERLMLLRVCNPTTGGCFTSFPDALIEESPRLTTIGPMAIVTFTGLFPISGASDDTPPLALHQASMNVLSVLGVRPFLGRDVTEEEVSQDRRVAFVTYETWQTKFGGAADILSRDARTPSGRAVPIIGVLPRGFVAPAWGMPSATWDGLALYAKPPSFAPIARLAPGATAEQATQEIRALVSALGPRVRGSREPADAPLPVIGVDSLESELFERFSEQAAIVAAAAGLVLLLACANLAGLLVTRGRSRERELALRVALGATRSRVVMATFLETGIVCLVGAVAAVGALIVTSDIVRLALPPLMARYALPATEWRSIAAAVLASLVCTLLAGMWPSIRAANLRPTEALLTASGTAGHGRLAGGRSILVIEAALSMVLVLGAAGTVRSFANLLNEGVGLDPRGLYNVSVLRTPGAPAPPRMAPQEALDAYTRLLDQMRTVPGALAVGGSDSVVGGGATAMRGFSTDRTIRGGRYEISAGYFSLLGSRPIAGREFTDSEIQSRAPLAVFNPEGLRAALPDVSPELAIGRTVTLAGDVPRVVIGVVPTLRDAYGAADRPTVFVPLGTQPVFYGSSLVRLADDSPDTAQAFRNALASRTGQRIRLDAVADAYTSGLRDPRFRAVIFMAFAVSGLVIAVAGIFALTAFDVARRQREIGVRLTLGAKPADVRRMVIREALAPVMAGVVIGTGGAVWAAEALQVFLYRADARDAYTIALVAAMLLLSAMVAAWIPARRAGRVDPAIVLRSQ
jgi:putative ABC transport system permease protein